MLTPMRAPPHPRIEQVALTDVMYALSDPARLRIVRALATARGALSCTQLHGDRPKSSMSHHFKILREAGILSTVIVGKEHLNSLRTRELEKRFPGLLKAVLRSS